MSIDLVGPQHRAVGLKQTLKAIRSGRADLVYLAGDADEELIRQVRDEAASRGIPHETVPTMSALGKICRIQVPAAAAARLRAD